MEVEGMIKDSKELEFAVFCIEGVAERLGVGAEDVYKCIDGQKRYPSRLHHSWL